MFKTLRAKKYRDGNRDVWWYTLSSPAKWMRRDRIINLVLYDESNSREIGAVTLRLDLHDWYERIMGATRRSRKGTVLVDVHIMRDHDGSLYYVYFGRKEDGIYPVRLS